VILDHDEILKIHTEAIQAGLASKRDQLLFGLERSYVAKLAENSKGSESDRLLADLAALNQDDETHQQKMALERWLRNASHAVNVQRSARVFRDWAEKVSAIASNKVSAENLEEDSKRILEQYLQVLLSGLSYLRIPGLDDPVLLEAIWTRPSFVLDDQGEMPLHKILAHLAVAIEAPAGFGKTTLAKMIAISLAKDFLQQKCPNAESWQSLYLGVNSGEHLHFPILVNLRGLQEFSGTDSLMREAAPTIGVTELPHFKALLEGGMVAVFILDGLDEVETNRSNRVIELISKARLRWENCYFILTSRNYEAEALVGAGFCVARMCTLSRTGIDELMNKWASVITKAGKARSAFVSDMQRVLAEETVERPFVNSPLMIAFLASIYIGSGRIPDNRARLFSRVADWLFKSRSAIREREEIDLGTTKETLEAVLSHM
jgi:hypothetical protein